MASSQSSSSTGSEPAGSEPERQKLEIFPREMSQKIEKKLRLISEKIIADALKTGVAEGPEVSNPRKVHHPHLLDAGKFSNWVLEVEPQPYAFDKRLKKLPKELPDMPPKSVHSIINEIKEGKHSEESKSFMVLGAAGMGKTVFLRHLAYQVLEEKMIALPLELHNFSLEEKVAPSNALFSRFFKDEKKMEQAYQWVKHNPRNVVFFIDSLDTMPVNLEKECAVIDNDEKTTTEIIVHNLLSGKLILGSTIVSSSREYKVRNLHPSLHPNRCIIIDGLPTESVEKIIDECLESEKANKLKNTLESKCAWVLLTIPAFLMFTIMGFTVDDADRILPDTSTAILMNFFRALVRSAQLRQVEGKIKDILLKSMEMCFEGICDGKVLFSSQDLKDVGLEPEEVAGITSSCIPGKGGWCAKLMLKDRSFFYFSHQTIQEFLAALHVLSMKEADFGRELRDKLYHPNFTMVRRFLHGILFNKPVFEAARALIEIPDARFKRKMLQKKQINVLTQVQENKDRRQVLELLMDLNEAKFGVSEAIRSCTKIDFCGFPLHTSEVQAVATVLKDSEHLSEVILSRGIIDVEKMDIITKTLMDSQLEIEHLDVTENKLGEEGASSLAKLCSHCDVRSLVMGGFGLKCEHLQAFIKGAIGAKFSKLKLDRCKELKPEDWQSIGGLMKDPILQLDATGCGLDAQKVENLVKGLKDKSKLKDLNVSGNDELESKGWEKLGTIVKKQKVEKFQAEECNFNSDKLHMLNRGMDEASVNVLNLTDNYHRPCYDRELLELLHHVKEELNLEGWEIEEDEKQKINNERDKTLQVKLGPETLLKACQLTPSPESRIPPQRNIYIQGANSTVQIGDRMAAGNLARENGTITQNQIGCSGSVSSSQQ